MFDRPLQTVKKIKENPQLISTIFIAAVICVAFGFAVSQFASIAIDAQNRLVNVRAGSIQDSLSAFVETKFDNTEVVRTVLNSLVRDNPTITEFNVISLASGTPRVEISINKNLEGIEDKDHEFLFTLARANPSSSFTAEDIVNGERSYETVRALKNESGEIIGFLYTRQSLSEADRAVADGIKQSIWIFTAIMGLVLLLFLRHSRIIDYISLYSKLKEVDSLKDDFISMASHELRAPLTAIRGYADEVKNAAELSAETRTQAERIDVSARQLADLVEEMLDVSRIEQGRMKFEMKNVNLSKVTKDAVDMFAPLAKEKGLALTFKAPDVATISADEGKLRQVLTNLISNAVKYTLKGSVDISIEEKKGRWVVCVSDTGVGLDAEGQKKLFQKFSRIYNEETTEVRGTGLGLWITKQIVESMGGTISVESIRNVGSHFIVEFPVVGK